MGVTITAASHCTLEGIEVPAELSRKLRRADDYINLAVVAAYSAIQANIEAGTVTPDRCGLVLGSCFSTMQTNFEVLDDVVSGKQTSPTLFSHSVFNAAAGYIASTLGLKGAAFTITDFSFPFFKALEQGCFAINSGRLESCLVLQVETYSDLLSDGRKRLVKESTSWHPGVICLLLQRVSEDSSTRLQINNIEINRRSCAPEAYLVGRQDLMIGKVKQTVFDPLDAGLKLVQLVTDMSHDGGNFSVSSDWGDIRMQLGTL